MSVGKSESLLRRDARTFCNKRHQRTIWEARRDERRTNQQLERELRYLERSRAYRERELDRDQVMFLNSFVEIFQRQCDIVAARKAPAVDVELSNEDYEGDAEQDDSQYGMQYDEYTEGGQDTMTVTTTEQQTTDGNSSNHDKETNSETSAVAELKRRKLLLHRDSLFPIIYTPSLYEGSTPRYSSRPGSPKPLVSSPSEIVESNTENDPENSQGGLPFLGTVSPDHITPRSAPRSPPRSLKQAQNVSAPVYHRRKLSPLNRYKIPESHFRADSPSSKNSTVYVNDVPDIGESVRGDRISRRTRLPPATSNTKLKTSGVGRRSQQDSRRKEREGEEDKVAAAEDKAAAAEESTLNTRFMLEFEEASRNALDPYSTGVDIEGIRKQFLVNSLAKKLKISALRSGKFAELDDIRKKIERRRKCVEGILEAKRRERQAAANAAGSVKEDPLEEVIQQTGMK